MNWHRSLIAALLLLGQACGDGGQVPPGPDGAAPITDDAGALDLASERPAYASHAGQYCSADPADDPFYECAPAAPLVCVSTYRQPVPPRTDAGDIPIYLCRVPCSAGSSCPEPADVCCPGFGITGQPQHACAPERWCDSLRRDR